MSAFLQAIAGLVIVLMVIGGAAWFMRRLVDSRSVRGQSMQIRGAIAVGPRERVVVVELADTCLVLGVAPGRVTALHTMPRSSMPEATAPGAVVTTPGAVPTAAGAVPTPVPGMASFAALLERLKNRRAAVRS